jgi:hypothetical protein
MMLASSYIPGDGLMSYLLGSWSMPLYFATPENQWDQFHPYLKDWIVPLQPDGVRWFHEGLPDFRVLPWDIWIRPIFGWASLGVAFVAASMVLTFFNEYLPDIDLNHGWVRLTGGGINVYTSQINLLTLGLSYFTSIEVLMSATVFFILKHIEIIIAARVGYTVPLGGGATHPGSASPLVSWQTVGAFFVYVAYSIWNARQHLRKTVRYAIENRPREREDFLSSRTAILLVIGGIAFLLCWLVSAGFEVHIAILLVFAVLVTYVGLSKMMAELGLPYLGSPLSAEAFAVATIGTSAMSPASVLMLSFTKNLKGYSSGMAMSHFTMLQKIRGQLDVRRLLVGVLLALVLAYLLSMFYTIWLGYQGGAYNFSSYTYYARRSYQRVVFRMANPWPFDVHRLTIMTVGGAVMAILMGMRYKLPWFRLNPVGLAIPLIPHQLSTFVVAWVIKTVMLRIGGMHTFQRGIPFFVGLIAGYASGVALSCGVDFFFFPGSGHGVHWW